MGSRICSAQIGARALTNGPSTKKIHTLFFASMVSLARLARVLSAASVDLSNILLSQIIAFVLVALV